jgi:hypothetical protein
MYISRVGFYYDIYECFLGFEEMLNKIYKLKKYLWKTKYLWLLFPNSMENTIEANAIYLFVAVISYLKCKQYFSFARILN